ncbi:hypothetical protein HN51_054064 [Arachis hypogaea]
MDSSFSTPNFDLGCCEAQTSFMDILTKFAATFKHFELKNPTRTNISNVLFHSKVFMLSSNNLRGNVPRIFPNVTLLDLSYNSLSGSISHFLCRKRKAKNNLKYLDLSHNLLSGEILNYWIH